MKMSKYVIHILFLFILSLVLANYSFYDQNINYISNNNNNIENKETFSAYGDPIAINEYANRTELNSPLLLKYNYSSNNYKTAKASIPLPASWIPSKLECNILNLQDKRNWIQDPKFESTGNWTFHKFHNTSGDNWIVGLDGTGPDGSNCIYIKMDSATISDSTAYSKFDAIYVSQIIKNIIRGNITEAYLSFDYKVNAYSWDLSSLGYNIFVAVNTSRPDQINKTYSYWTNDWGTAPLGIDDDICIWSCGDDVSDVLTSSDRTVIGNYLDAGGKCYLSGSSIAYDSSIVPKYDSWLDTYFKVAYSNAFGNMSYLNGVDDPYLGLNNVQLIDATQVDIIDNTTGGTICLEYNTGETSGVCSSNTIFHSFNFANIKSITNSSIILNRTLEYLNSSNIKNVLIVNDGTSDAVEKIIQAIDNIGFILMKIQLI
ncbi:MAG: hypothetical protein ACTSRP_15520 [Candidatus Helarchaeota archaeon]